MFIKICGITNLEDALMCAAAGADAIGFNFYPPSPRYIEPQAARTIIDNLSGNVLTVGVFVNQESPALVEQLADKSGVSAVQLHGEESAEYCRQLSDRHVIKVFRARSNFDPQTVLDYEVQAIMLDAFDQKLRGGTGRSVDWSQARKTRDLTSRLILAGGLSPENVADAIAAVNPYGVDACSALESIRGKKIPNRVASFIKNARGGC